MNPTPPSENRHQHDAETLLGVLADLYHVCGMLDAKVEVLDQIMAALNGEPLPHESLGPYAAPDPAGGVPAS